MCDCECECESSQDRWEQRETERIERFVQEATWNLSPAEMAEKIGDLGMDLNAVLREMKEMHFPPSQIGAVRDAYDTFVA